MIGAAHLGVIAGATPRASGGGGYSFWRIYFPNTGAAYLGLQEVEMYSTAGGANVCSGGTASASSTSPGSSPGNAFDGDSGTTWGSNTTTDQWIQYEFGSPKNIVQFKLVSASINFPTECKLQYSADGSAWTDATGLMQPRSWKPATAGQEQTFLVASTKSYWRLYVTANQSGNYTNISELEFRGSVGGADLTVPNGPGKFDSAYAGASTDRQAFDDDTATYWESGGGAPPHWLWYAFGEDVDIGEVSIRTGPYANESPADFKVQYSGDGTAWTDALTVTGETGWAAGETRTFAI